MTDAALRVRQAGYVARVARLWSDLNLAQQFLFTGSAVLLAGMLVIGFWVTRQIEIGVTHNTASSTALYMDSLIEPLVQPLADGDTLPVDAQIKLDHLFRSTSLGRQLVSVKLWKEDGLIVYATNRALVGQRLPTSDDFHKAWAGEVSAGFDSLEDEEDLLERAAGLPLLEMYSPIRERATGRIIAVGEFYEVAMALKQNLFWANLTSWLVVAVVTLLMLTVLSGIVFRGSRTIERQQRALRYRVAELSSLLQQNEELRERVQSASRRTAEINESYLRRISSDLHDGPAQLLALAALRIDSLKSMILKAIEPPCTAAADLDIVKEAVADALSEIRDVCAGLSLPELDAMSTAEVIRSAVRAHERRSGATVGLDIDSVPGKLSRSLKICIFRFIQEGLSNAFRHAGGAGQVVRCQYTGGSFEVRVIDSGPGFDVMQQAENRQGLGLPGLRDRVESLGGTFDVVSFIGRGTSLAAQWSLNEEELTNVGP